MALTKLCSKCHQPMPYGKSRCENCEQLFYSEQRYDKLNRNKTYNDSRDPKYAKFYASHGWKNLRLAKLVQCNFLCEDCKTASVVEVHHNIEISRDWNKRLDINNLVGLCTKCHNQRHGRFGERKIMRTSIVCGAPGSGKTTYVKNNMSNGDLIVDLDYLVAALSFQPLHYHDTNTLALCFSIRDFIYSKISTGLNHPHVWVIATMPDKLERARLSRRLNAEIIVIETPPEICLKHSQNDSDRIQTEDWAKTIAEWWARYTPNDGDKIIVVNE